MPSAKPGKQLAVLALGGLLATGGLSGCSTTQEKAAAQRSQSERILEAREKRQQKKSQQQNPQRKHDKEKG